MLPNLQPGEMLVVLVVAVLLFGKRLPEVGRSLGKGIIEFKKGLRGIDDFEEPAASGAYRESSHASTESLSLVNVPKFEPPTSAPTLQPSFEPQSFHD